ncbi:MAG TPA: sigma factor [Thermoleophilaceae bacterium]|nr:sigma factor [Thermoleophilaceae bacterium]
MATQELYEELRPGAFAIANRMLGSVSEAEYLVQEGFLRLHRALEDGEPLESPKAYLSTVVTRLAIDELRSARVRREGRRVAPGAAHHLRRGGPRAPRGDGRLAVARLPCPPREPLARAARGVLAA